MEVLDQTVKGVHLAGFFCALLPVVVQKLVVVLNWENNVGTATKNAIQQLHSTALQIMSGPSLRIYSLHCE